MNLKVCGITTLEQANALAEMPVDFIGFIGYKKSLRHAWDKLKPKEIAPLKNILKVGVFVNEDIDVIRQIVKDAALNFIQLHGNEPLETVKEVAKFIPVIKAISIQGSVSDLQNQIDAYADDVSYFLFDTATKHYGGSGKQFDWEILNQLEIPQPYFLSGGIKPETEIKKEQFVNPPFALDINSQFEKEPGIKNIKQVEDFKAINHL